MPDFEHSPFTTNVWQRLFTTADSVNAVFDPASDRAAAAFLAFRNNRKDDILKHLGPGDAALGEAREIPSNKERRGRILVALEDRSISAVTGTYRRTVAMAAGVLAALSPSAQFAERLTGFREARRNSAQATAAKASADLAAARAMPRSDQRGPKMRRAMGLLAMQIPRGIVDATLMLVSKVLQPVVTGALALPGFAVVLAGAIPASALSLVVGVPYAAVVTPARAIAYRSRSRAAGSDVEVETSEPTTEAAAGPAPVLAAATPTPEAAGPSPRIARALAYRPRAVSAPTDRGVS